MLQWFPRLSKFAEFTELNEGSAPFRENPIAVTIAHRAHFMTTSKYVIVVIVWTSSYFEVLASCYEIETEI